RAELDLVMADLASVPRAVSVMAMTILAEVCGELGAVAAKHASVLYDLLAPLERRCATLYAVACTGSVAYFLGLLAAVADDPDLACRHFALAREVNERIGAAPWLVRACHQHARALLARGLPGDGPQAADLLAAVSRGP